MNKSKIARAALSAALALCAAASQPALAQAVWGADPGRAMPAAPEAASGAKPLAESARFSPVAMPSAEALSSMAMAPADDMRVDWLLVVREGVEPLASDDPAAAKKAWINFTDRESIAPISGMEQGLVAGVVPASNVWRPDGVGGQAAVPQAFAVSKTGMARFKADLSPDASSAPAPEPKKDSSWSGVSSMWSKGVQAAQGKTPEEPDSSFGPLGLQALFGASGARLGFMRNPGAAGQSPDNVSHYSVRSGEGLVVAQVSGGAIRWMAIAVFPLPAGALGGLR